MFEKLSATQSEFNLRLCIFFGLMIFHIYKLDHPPTTIPQDGVISLYIYPYKHEIKFLIFDKNTPLPPHHNPPPPPIFYIKNECDLYLCQMKGEFKHVYVANSKPSSQTYF